jgi:hypothetical protein
MHQLSGVDRPRGEQQIANAVSRETLLKQIRLKVPGGTRDLAVDVQAESGTVMLAGLVNSFYAKQLLYHVCGQWAPGFQVIDATVVAAGKTARTA